MAQRPDPRHVAAVLALLPAPGTDGDRPFLLGIDGRSGSGKTALASAVAAATPGATVLRLEDAYRGWHGLRDGVQEIAARTVPPLRRGEPGRYRRYDWHAGALAETVTLQPSRAVVVEGCGAGSLPLAGLLDALVWLEAPAGERRRRAMARDADDWSERWPAWAAQESALLAERDARGAADLVLHTG